MIVVVSIVVTIFFFGHSADKFEYFVGHVFSVLGTDRGIEFGNKQLLIDILTIENGSN